MTLLDAFLLALFVLAAVDGWRTGFLLLLADLAAFGLGLASAFHFGVPAGELAGRLLPMSVGLRPFFGFAVLFLLTVGVARFALRPVRQRLAAFPVRDIGLDRAAGALLNVAKQWLALAVILNLLLFLPGLGTAARAIRAARLAPLFVLGRAEFEAALARVIAPAVYDTQDILTTKTISDVAIPVTAPVGTLTDDREAEQALLGLLNAERTSRGLAPLAWSEPLAQAARLQSRDMWRRQYFAHVNPDGADPFARLHQAGIVYLVAGENLALAPSTPIAHQGLMDSPEHRDNILSPEYQQVGIGVIRNGLYGAMFTQEFTN